MPKRELARDQEPSERIRRVIATLRGGRPGVDPVRADWDDPDSGLPSFGYRNFHLGRDEYGRGRIPKDRLWMYSPQGQEGKRPP